MNTTSLKLNKKNEINLVFLLFFIGIEINEFYLAPQTKDVSRKILRNKFGYLFFLILKLN